MNSFYYCLAPFFIRACDSLCILILTGIPVHNLFPAELQKGSPSGFFPPLALRYKLAYPSNNSSILDPVVENNYQLFMVERLIMMEDDNDLSLTDDPKKSTRTWQIPVYTMDTREC
ncbi:unnamed protein product [Coffea canephora]|uniref:Uncharacterized protein n=1 Tax=Coffea canephora TaxID=49390 RepID=A0A068UMT6_COFCA|nr:unnamed protein product [Coffea canephora]